MTLQSMSRWKAFALHLALSALIAATVITLVVLLWYPRPYFTAMGGEVLLRLLIGVDVVVGPLITLIIFDTSKPRLKYDLATIAVIQLAALMYGSYVMFQARPVYSVFVENRFEAVPANGIDQQSRERAPEAFRDLSLTGPRVVAFNPPTDPAEQQRFAIAVAMNGQDPADMPHLFVPYEQAAGRVARASRPLVSLAQRDKESAEQINEFVAAHGSKGRSLGYVPVKARNSDFTAVVDRNTGEIVGYLAINPW